ncbi:MAG: hypothetical protein ABIS67_11855, partial [Candidatus Eisenbacteria bacterium]
RGRAMVRPETLALVLFAAQIAILEPRRPGGLRRDIALVLIAWAWINAHLSFVNGFAYLGFHVVTAWWEGRSTATRDTVVGADARRRAARLACVGIAVLAISFVNPFGVRGVLQPLAFLAGGRTEPIYATISELGAIDWSVQWKSGLPLLMLGWPLLLVWRARRHGLDLVETLACVLFTAQALFSQRFKASYAVVAAPWVARALSEWLTLRRPTPLALPALPRAVAASVLMVSLGVFEWTIPQFPLGVSLDLRHYPVAACDFIQKSGVRGRAFNDFWYGGYMEWRFWPDRGRLPFMDGHLESGTEHDRTLYVLSQSDPAAWAQLDAEKRFDFLLLSPSAPSGADLRARLEADSAWATVFIDDAGVVMVSRGGPLDPLARKHAYRHLRVSQEAIESLLTRCAADASLREEVMTECRRQIAESRFHTVAQQLLAVLDRMAVAGAQ